MSKVCGVIAIIVELRIGGRAVKATIDTVGSLVRPECGPAIHSNEVKV